MTNVMTNVTNVLLMHYLFSRAFLGLLLALLGVDGLTAATAAAAAAG